MVGALAGEKTWELKVELTDEFEQLFIMEPASAKIILTQKTED